MYHQPEAQLFIGENYSEL